MRKLTVVIVITVVLLIGAAVAYFMYNKPHRDIASEKAAYSISARQLFAEFQDDEAKANEMYLNKVIEVSGVVEEIEEPSADQVNIVLKDEGEMFGVSCNFSGNHASEARNIAPGEQVKIKGLCTGMLMDVVLINCSISD